MIMTELCQEIKNWFDKDRFYGDFKIENNILTMNGAELPIKENQYYRIIGSVFNDGVHLMKSASSILIDEDFDGAIWLMAVPPAVISLANEIDEWQSKYGGADSANMSPYNSESFGGYSYSKSVGGSADGNNAGAGTWQSAFAKRLNAWRKI